MYEAVIGLEIHAQLKTDTKLFCDSRNDPDERHPNINICPVCMGHPGTLPVVNKKAVEAVVKVGLALGSTIARFSKFDRKNYFYPDLPKGYQISQYDMPLCEGGTVRVGAKDIGITRVHLEEDTGRLVHSASGASLVDFNRAGVPLMELVTEPDIRTAQEAADFAKKLQMIFQYLDVSDANMEKGQMRCEVNISMRKAGEKFGTKVEIKNLNSFGVVKDAIAYEIKRQTALLEQGKELVQETRGWDEHKKATVSQRMKESAHDYRYFPEPDLPMLKIGTHEGLVKDDTIDVDAIRASLPELPDQKLARFQEEFSLSENDASVLVSQKTFAAFYEHAVSELLQWYADESKKEPEGKEREKLAKLAANYLNTDIRRLINETGTPFTEMLVTPENFAELIFYTYQEKISSTVAKAVLDEMFRTGKDPSNIIDEKGLAGKQDAGELEALARAILAANEKAVADYKKGNQNALQFLFGKLMAETKGKADPKSGRELFIKLLG
ncbi:MAG: Asp-tRNA(Asn)/Glu-tRNA(Gln) amidotransferase subunit GatB [Candidatus Azambacteria bacterium]|nr:Asp-tRNA(Asn)/Glu-tRNA(Gln) amidotransferase subunit GatB [Candidatus Azambacteria bacterium]